MTSYLPDTLDFENSITWLSESEKSIMFLNSYATIKKVPISKGISVTDMPEGKVEFVRDPFVLL